MDLPLHSDNINLAHLKSGGNTVIAQRFKALQYSCSSRLIITVNQNSSPLYQGDLLALPDSHAPLQESSQARLSVQLG